MGKIRFQTNTGQIEIESKKITAFGPKFGDKKEPHCIIFIETSNDTNRSKIKKIDILITLSALTNIIFDDLDKERYEF